jgi:hypothetical protein
MDRYLFFHVPKTAGSSVREALRQLFGADQVGPPVEEEATGYDSAALSRYRVVVGHFSYEQVASFPDRRVLTFLRDPVEVVISRYYYYRNSPALEPTPLVLLCRDLSLRDVLERSGSLNVFFNDAVRRFAGDQSYALSDLEALALAKKNLAACDFVGIHEQMTDSLDLLSYTFGWPPCHSLPLTNVTAKRPAAAALDRETTALILESNRLDAELYQFGRELFERRKRAAWRSLIESRMPDGTIGPMTHAPPLRARTDDVANEGGPPSAPVNRNTVPRRSGSGEVRILSVALTGHDSGRAVVRSGEHCAIKVTLLAHVKIPDVSVTLRLFNSMKTLVYSTRSSRDHRYLAMEAGRLEQVVFDLPLTVFLGSYYVDVEVNSGGGANRQILDYLPRAAAVDVSGFSAEPFGGIADLMADVYSVDAEPAGTEYQIGHEIDFTDAGNSHLFTRTGWSAPEDWARWTDGPEAELVCRLPRPVRGQLLLTALVFPYCPDRSLEAEAIVNGRLLARWCFPAPGSYTELEVEVPRDVCAQDYLHIIFRVHEPRTPPASGPSPDTRALGLAFQRMVISRCSRWTWHRFRRT